MSGPVRPCDECDVEDTHPRHVIGSISLLETGRRGGCWHLDCHASHGCESCSQRLADAGYRHGEELVEHFAALRAEA